MSMSNLSILGTAFLIYVTHYFTSNERTNDNGVGAYDIKQNARCRLTDKRKRIHHQEWVPASLLCSSGKTGNSAAYKKNHSNDTPFAHM